MVAGLHLQESVAAGVGSLRLGWLGIVPVGDPAQAFVVCQVWGMHMMGWTPV